MIDFCMNKILLLLISLTFPLMAAQNESFSQSKKDLERIYADHAITFYCGCKYDKRKKGNMIDRSSCGYVPRNPITKSGKVNPRTTRIEWEHIVPAENFGRQFGCWSDGAPECVDSKGKAFKGRKCCEKASQQFRIMQADMHNLVPAIGELNGDRSNLRYDFEEARKGQYGECRFEVDFDQDRARIKKDIRGDVARTYLYMSDRYKMKLSPQELNKFSVWNKEDPVDAWEVEKNKRIKAIQVNGNPWISK
jgi:deoxyribonuclease I